MTQNDLNNINLQINNNKKPIVIYRGGLDTNYTTINIGFEFSALIVFYYRNPNNVISGVAPFILTSLQKSIKGALLAGDVRDIQRDIAYVYSGNFIIGNNYVQLKQLNNPYYESEPADNVVIIAFT